MYVLKHYVLVKCMYILKYCNLKIYIHLETLQTEMYVHFETLHSREMNNLKH